jgi:hypothetical protein
MTARNICQEFLKHYTRVDWQVLHSGDMKDRIWPKKRNRGHYRRGPTLGIKHMRPVESMIRFEREDFELKRAVALAKSAGMGVKEFIARFSYVVD